MERKYFKALNFDLDTHQLKAHYPGANYRQAYDDLRRFFKRHQFSHRQGSGYKIDVTNIGRQHDLTELLKPTEDIEIDCSVLLAEVEMPDTENGIFFQTGL